MQSERNKMESRGFRQEDKYYWDLLSKPVCVHVCERESTYA